MSSIYAVCELCDEVRPLNPKGRFPDFGCCEKCGKPMNLWTAAAVKRLRLQQANELA